MQFKEAKYRVLLAGRELGGGVLPALERICPGLIDELTEKEIREAKRVRADTQRRIDEREGVSRQMFEDILEKLGPVDEELIRRQQTRFVYGIAVGRVMGNEPEAMATLEQIYQEWRQSH